MLSTNNKVGNLLLNIKLGKVLLVLIIGFVFSQLFTNDKLNLLQKRDQTVNSYEKANKATKSIISNEITSNGESFIDQIKMKNITVYENIFRELYPDHSIIATSKFVDSFALKGNGYWYLPSGIELIRYKRPSVSNSVENILSEIQSIKLVNKSFINGVAFYNINGLSAYKDDFANQRAAQTKGFQVFIYRYHAGDITHEIGHIWQRKYLGNHLTNEHSDMAKYAKSRGWNLSQLDYNKWSERIIERQAEDFSNAFYQPINVRDWGDGYSRDYFIAKMNGDNSETNEFKYKIVTSENYKELIAPKLKAMYEEYEDIFRTNDLSEDITATKEEFDKDLEKLVYDRVNVDKGSKIDVYYANEKQVFFEYNDENYSTDTSLLKN